MLNVGAWIPDRVKYGEEARMQDWKSHGTVRQPVSQKVILIDTTKQNLKIYFCLSNSCQKKLSKYCHMGCRIVIAEYNICMYSYGELGESLFSGVQPC